MCRLYGLSVQLQTVAQERAAEKDCKKISNNKDVQEACKKVVEDVLKKKKDNPRDPLDACQDYGWC